MHWGEGVGGEMHGIVVLNFRRSRVGVLQEGPFTWLLSVSKHK